jgi:hypothetical protein
MRKSVQKLIEKIESRPGYDTLWRVIDDWPSTEAAREQYVRFASDFLRDEGFEVEPDSLGFVVNMFIALGQVSANDPIEQTLEELGAPKEWAWVYETMAGNILEEPEVQVGPLVDAVQEQLSTRGYKVDDDALEALCAIEVALHRP